MKIPKMRELYNPIIGLINKYEVLNLSEIRRFMLDYFFLDEEYLSERELGAFSGRVNNVCSNMVKDGLLHRASLGRYSLTSLGKEIDDKKITLYSRLGSEEKGVLRQSEPQFGDEIDLLTLASISSYDSRMNNLLESGLYADTNRENVFCEKKIENVDSPWWISEKCRCFYCKTQISSEALNVFRNKSDVENAKKILSMRSEISKASSFNVIFRMLMDEYKISNIKVSELTGISESMIKRLRKDKISDRKGKIIDQDKIIIGKDETSISIQDLSSLFIIMRIPPLLFDDCLDVALCRTTKEATARYKTIIELMYGEENRVIGRDYVMRINNMCDALSIARMFPQKLTEEGYWEDIEFI